jgi:hypothetical protein
MGGIRRSPGDRRDRGAALVEMALVLPLLLMLLLGIVSAGLAYNHQLALTHSAREAGRFAATLPVDSMAGWLDTVEARVIADATGSLDAGTPGRRICVAYVHPGAGEIAKKDDGAMTNGATCFSDGRPDEERRVQILVEREVDFNAMVFQTTLTLDARAVNRFEAALGLG